MTNVSFISCKMLSLVAEKTPPPLIGGFMKLIALLLMAFQMTTAAADTYVSPYHVPMAHTSRGT